MIDRGNGRFASIFMMAMLLAAPALAGGSAVSGGAHPLAVPVSGDQLSRIRGETYADTLAAAPRAGSGDVSVGASGTLVAPVSRSAGIVAIAHARLVQIQTEVSMTAR